MESSSILLQDSFDIAHVSSGAPAKSAIEANQCIIDELSQEIKDLRFNSSLPPPILCWELVRLFDLHDKLVIESNRRYEQNCKKVLETLNLEEIGGKPVLQGGGVMHAMIKSQNSSKPLNRPTRANTAPRSPPFNFNLANIERLPPNEREAAVTKRKEEISAALIQLSRNPNPSPNDISNKQKLMDEMTALQRISYQNSSTTNFFAFN